MVIQRIQTLFLLLAAILMAVFMFMPFGYTQISDPASAESLTTASLKAIEFAGLWIPGGLSVILLLIDIFLFKNLNLQKRVIVLCSLLTLTCIGIVIYILTAGMHDTDPQLSASTVWGGGGLMAVAALLAMILAYRNISADQKLLRSYDHFR